MSVVVHPLVMSSSFTSEIDMTLKSYKVFSRDGGQVFTIICGNFWTVKELNDLFQKGMKVTVIDQRSELVNKNIVDKQGT